MAALQIQISKCGFHKAQENVYNKGKPIALPIYTGTALPDTGPLTAQGETACSVAS